VNKRILLGVIAALLIVQGVLHHGLIYPQWNKNYAPKQKGMVSGLDPSQLLFAVMGLREFIAGILWVRADSFFDEGNYDAVLPLLRLVTWLDPHQIDVYATGMWHIGYNFTDTEQRSDRRYIPIALAFGKEGAANNPETYEMFFETGWMWYHKIDDNYENAVRYWEIAHTKPDMLPARKNLLAMAYFRNGQIEKALDMYFKLYDEAKARIDADPTQYALKQNYETLERNIDTNLVRLVQRGYVALKNGWYDQGDYDTKPPFDVGFSVKATVDEAAIITFEGTWNVLPVGTRIRVVLKDKDLSVARTVDGKEQKVSIDQPGGMVWDQGNEVNFNVPKDVTYMQEGLFVRNRRFRKRIDMSNDRTMYPFRKKDYVLEFYYNPRSAPPHIQDKFGWDGIGMTDKYFLNDQIRPGQRVIFARLELTRDQILRRGEWTDKVPVVKTPNYKESKTIDKATDIFETGSMRATSNQ